MAARTDHQKLQARAKALDIPANQSSDKLEKAIVKAEAKAEATKGREEAKAGGAQRRETQKASAASKGRGSSDETRKPKASESEEGPELSEYGGVSPEWHNDPERTLGLDELEARKAFKGRGEVKVETFTPQTHNELTINFTNLRPDTDFEVRISGPIAQPYWTTLKTDGWGQAQLIWRTAAGGDYEISAKGPGVDVKGEFSVSSYDADANYRAEKRGKRSKRSKGRTKDTGAASGSVLSVEEPGVMGDPSSGEVKNQPTEEELANPRQYDPGYRSAVHDPDDQGDPTINKTPHPEGSAQFNYREPGEVETVEEESKEGDPKTQGQRQEDAQEEAAEETAEAESDAETPAGKVSKDAGQSPPMSDEQVDQENAQTGAEEAGR